MRRIPLLACLALCLALAACNAVTAITQRDIAEKPTTAAVVVKEPDAQLLGCFTRPRPEEYNRPNSYEFCLVKSGDQYGMYYYMKDGKSQAVFKGWTPCQIDGDSVTSGYDNARYFLKDGGLWQTTTVGGPHRMLPLKN